MDSTHKRIREIVLAGEEGKVYFPSDFFDCGTEKAVSKALQRLVKEEVLIRMYRGIYCRPHPSEWGMGLLPASSYAVVDAFAQRYNFRLAPSFGEAQNMLGMSTQVVMNPVYSTDGPSRTIYYSEGHPPIVLYHVSPSIFAIKNRIVMLTVIALSKTPKDRLWEWDLDYLKAIFKKMPYSEVRNDLKIVPSWIRSLIMEQYGN